MQQQTDTKEALSRLQAELDARQHEQETHVVQIKDKQSKTIALETDLSALRSQRALILEGRPTHEVENQNRRRQRSAAGLEVRQPQGREPWRKKQGYIQP